LTLSRKSKIAELLKFDKKYMQTGSLIGTDEAGRGPVAGPVMAGAVHFKDINNDLKQALKYLDDSKKFSSNIKLRKEISEEIKKCSYWSVCECSVKEIQKHNILKASLLAMKKACGDVIGQLEKDVTKIILVDGKFIMKDCFYEQIPVIKGDSKSAAIAAASILAKVCRDEMMIKLSEEFPQYGWHKNKGYGTKAHLEAIQNFGITTWHRKEFLKKHISIN
jgi:ribonuclease HII